MASEGKLKRIFALVHILRSHKAHTGTIADYMQVSKRTVFRDLRALRNADVNVLYDDVEMGYFIADDTYSPVPFTDKEYLALRVLLTICKATFPNVDVFRWGVMALSRVLENEGKRKCLFDEMGMVDLLLTNSFVTHSAGKNDEDLQGYFKNLNHLIEASLYRRCLRIKMNQGEATLITLISPYIVRCTNDGWTVRGRSSIHRRVISLKIEDVLEIESVEQLFTAPPRFIRKDLRKVRKRAG